MEKHEELYNYIRSHIDSYGFPPTVREMCRALNVTSTSTIAYYIEKLSRLGMIKRNPNKNRALEIIDNDKITNIKDFVSIPNVGKITAGMPILAVENIEEYFVVSPNLFKGEGLFMLNVSGESMINAGINDGDKIIVRQQPTANNGDIVVALIDDSATVKRFYKENGKFRLQPENDTMQPIIVDDVKVLGKVVGLIRQF